MAGARKRRVRGRFYSVLDAVKGMLADTEPRVRECERRRTERIERREVVRDLDHGHDGHDRRPDSNSRSIRRFSEHVFNMTERKLSRLCRLPAATAALSLQSGAKANDALSRVCRVLRPPSAGNFAAEKF